ncbi:MAG: hypothetical protein ACP5GF_12445 [Thiomonas sp.]
MSLGCTQKQKRPHGEGIGPGLLTLAERQRQNDYLQALALRGVRCQFGHYLHKTRHCRQCGATWPDGYALSRPATGR